MELILILVIAFLSLVVAFVSQLSKLDTYARTWALIGLSGQLTGMVGQMFDNRKLSALADVFLFICVGGSVFLDNKILIAYSLLTVIIVSVLYCIHGKCLLTSEDWNVVTKISAPVFILILTGRLVLPKKIDVR